MNRIFTTLAILLSLLSFFYATDNACANHDIRISWGAYLSTSKLTGLIPLATPQFDIGYRFFDNHVGIYLDTTYHYSSSKMGDGESYDYQSHYFRAGVTARIYPYVSDFSDVYVAAGVGVELSRFVYHPSDDNYQPNDKTVGSFGSPKFEVGCNFLLYKNFYLGFKGTTILSFYEAKGEYVSEWDGENSWFVPFQVGVDLVASYRF